MIKSSSIALQQSSMFPKVLTHRLRLAVWPEIVDLDVCGMSLMNCGDESVSSQYNISISSLPHSLERNKEELEMYLRWIVKYLEAPKCH